MGKDAIGKGSVGEVFKDAVGRDGMGKDRVSACENKFKLVVCGSNSGDKGGGVC